ncbi:hypothetical protein [Uliginosibacterium sp. H1]|uniref:hypothetical protein n=1 Tax=Uliginosibacterium sp. H1 TaxID=3114757 RepID=UPI002E18D936|nr:hypothetical protein [Uliginosibacterium sp. H1]
MIFRTILLALSGLLLVGCDTQTPAAASLFDAGVRTAVVLTEWPGKVATDADFPVGVRVFNSGTVLIPSLPAVSEKGKRVGVSYHWFGTDNRLVQWDGLVTSLGSDVRPGGDLDVALKVRAPAEPGRYILEVDLLQTGVFWFAGSGSQTARVVVDVSAELP